MEYACRGGRDTTPSLEPSFNSSMGSDSVGSCPVGCGPMESGPMRSGPVASVGNGLSHASGEALAQFPLLNIDCQSTQQNGKLLTLGFVR